jgi:phospholipid transport system transporter-binding protein
VAAGHPDAAGPGAFRLTPSADARLLAAGPLTFATARGAGASGEAALAEGPSAREIDCSGVTSADSAGLAVLIDWLGVAKRTGRRLRYTQLPEGLTALARISELAELLERGV